jgi:hypothetical protein
VVNPRIDCAEINCSCCIDGNAALISTTFSLKRAIACPWIGVDDINACKNVVSASPAKPGGSIPSELAMLTQLTELGFRSNALTGSIPSELALLAQLIQLDCGDNALTGSIPSELGLLTQLIQLDFGDNVLTGGIPSEFGMLTKLYHLWLHSNALTGPIPTQFGMVLTQLTNGWILTIMH